MSKIDKKSLKIKLYDTDSDSDTETEEKNDGRVSRAEFKQPTSESKNDSKTDPKSLNKQSTK